MCSSRGASPQLVLHRHDKNNENHENQKHVVNADEPNVNIQAFVEDLPEWLRHLLQRFLYVGIIEKL